MLLELVHRHQQTLLLFQRKENEMPQHLRKVTPEYAKKWYNVVIGTDVSPTGGDVGTQDFTPNVNRFTTGGGAVIDEVKNQQPPKSNGDNLF
jgi:hypothetical protein